MLTDKDYRDILIYACMCGAPTPVGLHFETLGERIIHVKSDSISYGTTCIWNIKDYMCSDALFEDEYADILNTISKVTLGKRREVTDAEADYFNDAMKKLPLRDDICSITHGTVKWLCYTKSDRFLKCLISSRDKFYLELSGGNYRLFEWDDTHLYVSTGNAIGILDRELVLNRLRNWNTSQRALVNLWAISQGLNIDCGNNKVLVDATRISCNGIVLHHEDPTRIVADYDARKVIDDRVREWAGQYVLLNDDIAKKLENAFQSMELVEYEYEILHVGTTNKLWYLYSDTLYCGINMYYMPDLGAGFAEDSNGSCFLIREGEKLRAFGLGEMNFYDFKIPRPEIGDLLNTLCERMKVETVREAASLIGRALGQVITKSTDYTKLYALIENKLLPEEKQ